MKFKVGLGQFTPITGDKKLNLEKMIYYIEKAASHESKLVVFPELALTGYHCGDNFYDVAETVPGPSCEILERRARSLGIHIVWGMPERGLDGVLYNTAVLVGPSGYIGKWRKHVLPGHATDVTGLGAFPDRRFFRRGITSPVFDTELGRLGLLVCYDIFFPELSRLLTLKGCDLIIGISGSPDFERDIFESLTRVRAMENTVWFAYVNLVGKEGEARYWGGSCLIAPGDPVKKLPGSPIVAKASYTDEELTVGEVDTSTALQFRRFFPVLRDVEPWFYEELQNEALALK